MKQLERIYDFHNMELGSSGPVSSDRNVEDISLCGTCELELMERSGMERVMEIRSINIVQVIHLENV